MQSVARRWLIFWFGINRYK